MPNVAGYAKLFRITQVDKSSHNKSFHRQNVVNVEDPEGPQYLSDFQVQTV